MSLQTVSLRFQNVADKAIKDANNALLALKSAGELLGIEISISAIK